MTTCAHCGIEFPQAPGRGRPRTTCGDDCAYFLRLERAQARYHAARQLGATWQDAMRLAQSPRALAALRGERALEELAAEAQKHGLGY